MLFDRIGALTARGRKQALWCGCISLRDGVVVLMRCTDIAALLQCDSVAILLQCGSVAILLRCGGVAVLLECGGVSVLFSISRLIHLSRMFTFITLILKMQAEL